MNAVAVVAAKTSSPARPSSLLAFLLAIVLVVGCSEDPVRPFPSPPTVLYPTIDYFPVWAHDGSSIAYLRVVPCADGPPGIYLVSKWGGTPRLVTPGFFLRFQFSPDDQRLVTIAENFQVAVIDLATGSVAQPFYTDNLLGSPDWSPDGTEIVYLRGDPTPGEPPDSGGMHIFTLSTGIDRAVTVGGAVVGGLGALWLPTGDIAIIGSSPSGREQLAVTDETGSIWRVLHVSRRSSNSFWLCTWYNRPSTGSFGVLFTDNDAPPYGGIFLARPDGSSLTIMPPFRPTVIGNDFNTFSPDGEEWVHHGFTPIDSLDLLFVSRMGDMSGASRRQLTRYSPPSGAVAGTGKSVPLMRKRGGEQ